MQNLLILILMCLTLAACGADGPPVPPTTDATISIGGDVSVGLTTRIN